jgi:peptidoglycan/xylan/chitin deacetylase (PgdA/CDA1 family)
MTDAPAHGLMFHRFHQSGSAPQGQGSHTASEFKAILEHAGVDRILSPAEWLERTKGDRLVDGDLCITFDDGLRSQYEVALPVLDELGLKAFWFIFSSAVKGQPDRNELYNGFATSMFVTFDEFVEAFLSFTSAGPERFTTDAFRSFEKELRARAPFYSDRDIEFRYVRNNMSRQAYETSMDAFIEAAGVHVEDLAAGRWMHEDHLVDLHRAGHAIGLHSYDHPFELGKLPIAEQHEQYARNKSHLHSVTGKPPVSMSHPMNSYSGDTLALLKDLGIMCGFRATMTPASDRGVNPGPLELARADSSIVLRRLTAAEPGKYVSGRGST